MDRQEAIKIFEELKKDFEALDVDKHVLSNTEHHTARLKERTQRAIMFAFGEKSLYYGKIKNLYFTKKDTFESDKTQAIHTITMILDELRIGSD